MLKYKYCKTAKMWKDSKCKNAKMWKKIKIWKRSKRENGENTIFFNVKKQKGKSAKNPKIFK